MTRQERLLRLARLRGDRAAEAIIEGQRGSRDYLWRDLWRYQKWTEAELRAAWGDR